jgi:hypothetical protein
MNEKELEHNRIAHKMNQLHTQSIYVAIGFIVFWFLLASAFGFTLWHYWISAWIH